MADPYQTAMALRGMQPAQVVAPTGEPGSPGAPAAPMLPMAPMAPGGMDPNMMEKFAEMFKNLSKEEKDKYLARLARDYEGEENALGRADEFADALRMDAPGMRDAGRFKVAANPLEHLNKTAGDLSSAYISRGNQDKRAGMSMDKQQGVADMLRGMATR